LATGDQDVAHVIGMDDEDQLLPAHPQMGQITLSAPLIHEELQGAVGSDLPCNLDEAGAARLGDPRRARSQVGSPHKWTGLIPVSA
jgi:hypothetical protein